MKEVKHNHTINDIRLNHTGNNDTELEYINPQKRREQFHKEVHNHGIENEKQEEVDKGGENNI